MALQFRQDRIRRIVGSYPSSVRTAAHKALTEELTKGLKRGDNPVVVSRRIRKRIIDIAAGRAMTVARTEMMVAQWERTAQDFQRDALVDGWQWMAQLDGRTCLVCRAMHGTKHPKAERIESHPNCRCTMAPILPGFQPIDEDQTGEAQFKRLSAREQRRALGDGRYDAYKRSGSLGAMVERTGHPVYGGGRRVVPLRRLA